MQARFVGNLNLALSRSNHHLLTRQLSMASGWLAQIAVTAALSDACARRCHSGSDAHTGRCRGGLPCPGRLAVWRSHSLLALWQGRALRRCLTLWFAFAWLGFWASRPSMTAIVGSALLGQLNSALPSGFELTFDFEAVPRFKQLKHWRTTK